LLFGLREKRNPVVFRSACCSSPLDRPESMAVFGVIDDRALPPGPKIVLEELRLARIVVDRIVVTIPEKILIRVHAAEGHFARRGENHVERSARRISHQVSVLRAERTIR